MSGHSCCWWSRSQPPFSRSASSTCTGSPLGVGVVTLIYSVANRSLLPSLVARGELVEANSRLEIGLSASQVAGPGSAGTLTRLFGAPVALIADAVSSAVSALVIWTVRAPEPQPETPQRRGDLIEEARQGLGLIRRSSVLLAIAGAVGGFTLTSVHESPDTSHRP